MNVFLACCAVLCALMIPPGAAPADEGTWAIAVHGGAGTIPKDMDPERAAAYRTAMEDALRLGADMLAAGSPGLDVVEAVVRALEDDPKFNAGKGAVFTHEGKNELDAAIMDGATLRCGAVTGVTRVKNPVTLARAVMERSRHVFFTGAGAEQFAAQAGIEMVEPSYFFDQRRYDQLQEALETDTIEFLPSDDKKGTVGCVVLDRAGHLAAATSTGGLTNKRFGRVGDVPVIGAGTYADDRSCAVSCTGTGELFIRNTVARSVAAMMEFGGTSLEAAANEMIHRRLKPGDGGLIAVSRTGEIALTFNTTGMYRGAADAKGRFEVAIWEE